jgi:5-methylcytosine-specific restriction endonuclease McrA
MGAYVYPFTDADEETKKAVWNKGQPIPGYNSAEWRRDVCGHAIRYSDHANTNSEYGWEIDHIFPRAKGGRTTLDNLQPLFWQTNRRKGDNYPWSCN